MTFSTALSGINAARANLDSTGNNIANVNTTGFKGSRTEFSDVFGATRNGVSSTQGGGGVRVAGVTQQFAQGSVEFTDNALDLAINGDGFFTLSDQGERVYARAGAFGLNREGFVENSSGHRLQMFPANASGAFNTGALTDVQITADDNPPTATTGITFGANLPASASPPAVAAFDPTDPDSYNHTTSLTTFDSLGSAHVATLYFSKGAAANEWTMHTYVDGNEVSAAGGDALQFDTDGTLLAPAGGSVTLPTFTPSGGAAPQDIQVDVSDLTQFSNTFNANVVQQDGFTTGRLVGIETSTEGVIVARFTNGQSTPLGQLAMSRFANPEGLDQLGDTAWAESFASGQPTTGAAGSGSFGAIQSGALESSNVNLSRELVNMIVAQRNFQANAQMIQAEDQVTQTVINIR